MNNDYPTKRSSTVILDAKMAGFALFSPWGPFVGLREEQVKMVLFSSYRWYLNYRVIPESSGLPKILGNTQSFGLPATGWFPKLNRVGYRKKYRVAGRIRVPAGHCPHPVLRDTWTAPNNIMSEKRNSFSMCLKIMYMTHSQMFQKVESDLPAKIWRLVGCTEMISW